MKRTIKTLSLLFLLTVSIFAFSLTGKAADMNSTAGRVSVTEGNLNIRKSASVSSEIIKTVKNKAYLTLMSKSGNWWKVEYAKGRYGYCHKDYITALSSFAASVDTSYGSLNVRSGAGTSYSVKTTLPKSTVVVVLSQKDSWSRILYHGNKTGYVSSAYLKKNTYKNISLDVPSFKQTDSRWAGVLIGTQGDTIGTSGCTTTCLAMTESFRTGKSINPKTMSQKLSYSSSGMLYWPSDYATEVVTSEAYLKKIYSVLSKGKPVIFGMKKANSSSQHWVVVTGFSGGTLTASAFTVNDPGSKTRTTLSQVMSVYPTPYKIAYVK